MSSAFDLSVVGPVLYVSVGALAVLLGDLALGSGATRARVSVQLALISAFALLVALGASWASLGSGTSTVFNSAAPMLRLDPFSSYVTAVIALGALFSVVLSILYLRELRIDQAEYYALLLLSTAGMFALVLAIDLIAVYLALELMSLPLYALAGFDRARQRSNEAGLKYFLTGAFASAVLLYGIALLYGATGATSFGGIRAAFDVDSPLAVAGLALVVAGFAFKVAAAPFHQWAPDVYEGAPTSVTTFVSVAVTAAAFAALARFSVEAIPNAVERLSGTLSVIAALTLVVGNLMAAVQTNVKRLLAYSGVAHTGLLLVALTAGTREAHTALLLYAFLYVFMSAGAFGVLIALTRSGHECERLEDFAGLGRRSPGLAGAMSIFVLSLLGVPGTAGFVAKLFVLRAAVDAGWVALAMLAIAVSVLSAWYYLRILIAMYMQPSIEEEHHGAAGSAERLALAGCALAVLYFGILPGAAIERATRAAASLIP